MQVRWNLWLVYAFALVMLFNSEAAAKQKAVQGEWTVIPRYWFATYESAERFETGTTFMENSEAVDAPFYGVTVGFNPLELEFFDFILSGYDGDGEGKYNSVDTSGATTEGNLRLERTDLEILARHHVWPKSSAYLIYGFRWIHVENSLDIISPALVPDIEEKSDVYLFELGAGHSTAVTEDGRVRIFSNIVFGYGWNDYEDRTGGQLVVAESSDTCALDLNFGLLWVATSDNMNIHARYRGVQIGEKLDFKEAIFIHGPEIGISFRF